MTRLTSIFGATTIAAAIAAGIFWQQLRAERLQSAQLLEHVAQLEQKLAATPAAMPRVAAIATPDAPAPGTATTASSTLPPPARPMPTVAAPLSVPDITRDPDFCVAQKASMRAQLPQAYPDVAKVLGLAAAQSTALTELLLKQQESTLPCGNEDGRRPRPSLQAQQAELQSLLGAAKYAEFQEYLPTREGRLRVIQLRNALSTSDAPLTDQQAEPLLASVLAEGKRRRDDLAARVPPDDPRGRLDFEEETINLTEASQNRLLGSAQSYLSPQQIAVMKNSMTQQVAMQRAMLRARRTRMEAGGNSGPAQVIMAPR